MLLRQWKQLFVFPSQQASLRSCAVAFNSTQAVSKENSTVDPELQNAKSFDEIPGRKGVLGMLRGLRDFLPFVGKFSSDKPFSLSELHMDLYREYGPIYRLDMPGNKQTFVFVADPEEIRKVFAHEGRYPYRDMLPSLTEYRKTKPNFYPNRGLLSENNERWHHIRSKAQVPMLKPQITETYIPKMAAVSEEFLERIQNLRDDKTEVPDFLNELYRWSLESTGLVAFNTRLGCLSKESSAPDSESQRMIQATIDSFETLLKLEMKNPFKTSARRSKEVAKLAASQEFIRSVATKYCNLTLEKMQQSSNIEDEDFGVMGELLQRKDLDIRDICTLALDLLMAGIETTAHTAAFTLYLLARNMDEQEKVADEIYRVLPSSETPITPKIVHNMKRVRASVKETLRVMSTVDGTLRVLDHDIVLNGYRVPAGTILLVVTQLAAKLPQNFPQPDKFLPERWMSADKPHPFSNLPFGHGPRSCIGRRVALQELHLLVIKLLRKYRVEYHHEDIRRMSRLVNMPDKPMRLNFIDRK